MRYADMPSIAGVQSIDDLGGGITYGNSSFSSPKTPPFVVDWEIVDKQLEGLWDDGTESTTDDPTDPVPTDPDPVDPIDEEKKIAQDKWRKIFANSIEEGNRKGRSEQESMDMAVRYSKVMTPEENEEFRWAFSDTTNAPGWSKWGGGNKMGSGGGVKSSGENSGLGLGFTLGQAARNFTSQFSPTQGKVGGGRKNSATKGGTTAPGNQGAGAMRSDIQLKENIHYINTSPEGHSIYEWNYKGEPKSKRYKGVMAQELLKTAPHAVVTMDSGYLGVKYDEIDVDFTVTS